MKRSKEEFISDVSEVYFGGNENIAKNLITLIDDCYNDYTSDDLLDYEQGEYTHILCDFAESNDTYYSYYYRAYDYLKNDLGGNSFALSTIDYIIRTYITEIKG